MKSTRAHEPVQSVTQAPQALSDDQARRFRNYAIQMSIRTLCFLACVLIDSWVRWVFAVFAVFLPYVAVLLVNAGRDQKHTDVMRVDRQVIGAAPSVQTPTGAPGGPAHHAPAAQEPWDPEHERGHDDPRDGGHDGAAPPDAPGTHDAGPEDSR
ncbi:DUF3099 domain-containing protein [Cellulomonas sp. PhB143]|uniref:DUF3099 domain-containing protein n=1 Tax=Cellulomonas sp. PhB143 TaxID=2485186 RepID=UPI000F4934A3|nr:DUF3099 domain-containing protein [Cellulomonas sp. PhB143]ROS74326.1 DUF3099 family protein [Cellulomonas sp. PhB143]